MGHRHLPAFLETLERHGVEPRLFMKALEEYSDLATELVLEEEPQRDPHAFLGLSDERDVVAAFYKLFSWQSPHLLFSDDDEEGEEFEGV